MNVNYVDNEYLKNYFAEEDEEVKPQLEEEVYQIPKELQGVTAD